MIRNEYADIARAEVPDDALDIQHRNGVDARKWFIQQHELRLCRKRPRDFDPAPLAAGQALTDAIADVPDVQLFQQRFEQFLAPFADSVPIGFPEWRVMFSATVSLRKTEASCGK